MTRQATDPSVGYDPTQDSNSSWFARLVRMEDIARARTSHLSRADKVDGRKGRSYVLKLLEGRLAWQIKDK